MPEHFGRAGAEKFLLTRIRTLFANGHQVFGGVDVNTFGDVDPSDSVSIFFS